MNLFTLIYGLAAMTAITLFGSLNAAPPRDLPQAPSRAENLILKAPVTRWDDALPLGNGLMGALLWGEGTKLKLSLDRGDLWDERTHG